jgi:hypothetical protein|tara:strand:- start:380 stop:613 length:234 start_codon:yes stop_codon:yes gene_type:complete
MILPLKYQTSTQSERNEIVKKISSRFVSLNNSKYPKIALTLKAGNSKTNQLLNLIINQMYSNNFNLEDSFLAVEENI